MFCVHCGKQIADTAAFCPACGNQSREEKAAPATQPQAPFYSQQQPAVAYTAPKKRMTAGLLAIFLGAFGAHKFYLGYTEPALIHVGVAIFTFGIVSGIVGLVEGIIYLTMSDEEFYRVYVANVKRWF